MANNEYATRIFESIDTIVERAPRVYHISSFILYFIFNPTDVAIQFKRPTDAETWKVEKCIGEYQVETGYGECCWTQATSSFGHSIEHYLSDDRLNSGVRTWIENSTTPICFFPHIALLGYANLVLTNVVMCINTVLYLRHFRSSKLGSMINSIVYCLKEFAWWCLVAVCFTIPYAVLQFNFLFPNSLLKSIDEGYDCGDDSLRVW